MTNSTDDTQTSTTGLPRAIGRFAQDTMADMADRLLLDELRRNAAVATRRIRVDFVEVHTPARVLGYVRGERQGFVALRGDDPAWADEIGRYPTEALAVEALRMRRG